MKQILWIASAFLLSACGDNATDLPAVADPPEVEMPDEAEVVDDVADIVDNSVEPPPVYNEEIWRISDFWPGEYPPGFSILEDDVSVRARPVMHDSAVKTLTCNLPKNATYQAWNQARVEADDLNFVSLSEMYDITMSADASIEGDTVGGLVTLDLKAGDTLTYLNYFGEGFAAVLHDGQEAGIQLYDLKDVSDIETAGIDAREMLWVEVPCENGERGWLLYDEVITHDDIVDTPIIGYGEARDLTEQDRIDAIAQAKYMEEAATADGN